jgi:hypothetical protein
MGFATATILCAIVIGSNNIIFHPASGFSTPRSSTTTAKALVSDTIVIASQNHGVRCLVSSSSRRRGKSCLSAAASDNDEEEGEPEFETEATTTGLFIPGFSDKFAPPPPEPEKPAAAATSAVPKTKEQSEPNRTPTITISNPFASKSPTVDIPPPITTTKKLSPSVKDLSEDVSRSIIDLPSLPKLSLPSLFGEKKKKPIPPSKPPPPRSKTEDAIASAVGGTIAGAIVGLYADVATDILMDTDLPPLIPPAALGVALGAGAFVGANQENILGQAIRFLFGKPVLGVRNKITNKITETVEDIKATPTRLKDAAVQKVEDVVDEIKATPGKIKDAAVQKVEDVVDEIKVIHILRGFPIGGMSCCCTL